MATHPATELCSVSVVAVVEGLRTRWHGLTSVQSDTVLYGSSALFALLFALTTTEAAQRRWAWVALPTYVAVTLGSWALQSRHATRGRTVLLLVAIVGATALPLGLEAHARATQVGGGNAQPEVGVIERSGQALAHGQSPYYTYLHNGHLVHTLKGVPTFESFFPYFPLMGIFGLPSAETHQGRGLTDARIVMSLVTLLLTLLALRLLRVRDDARTRIAQVLLALPFGALFLATGGDDMPILALLLLGVVGLQRRSAWGAGLAFGVAAAMKLTAWPLTLVAMLVTWGRAGWRAALRQAWWSAAVVLVTVVPYIVRSPRAFVTNVVAFPLGLAHVNSPAASDLPGHVVATWSPVAGHVLAPLAFVVGGYFAVRWVRQSWPLTTSQGLALVASVMLVAMCVATATRVGYLIYPLNFYLWSRLIRETADVTV